MVKRHFLWLIQLSRVRAGILCTEAVMQDIANFTQILTLSSRKADFDLVYHLKIINQLNCPELLHCVNFHVPVGTHHVQSFSRHHHHHTHSRQTAHAYHSIKHCLHCLATLPSWTADILLQQKVLSRLAGQINS